MKANVRIWSASGMTDPQPPDGEDDRIAAGNPDPIDRYDQSPDGELHIDDDSELMEATREALGESAQPPEGERWTIWVCDGCGAFGSARSLDRFGQSIVHHGKASEKCSELARKIEVVPAQAAHQRIEELEAQVRTAAELVQDGQSYSDLAHDHMRMVKETDRLQARIDSLTAAMERIEHTADVPTDIATNIHEAVEVVRLLYAIRDIGRAALTPDDGGEGK